MIHITKSHTIVTAHAIFPDGTSQALNEKPTRNGKQSKNLFFKKIIHGEFRIQLRMDWGFLNMYNGPYLDIDIFKQGEKYTKNRKQWHHTDKIVENGVLVYKWIPDIPELQSLTIEVKFKLQTTNVQTISAVGHIIKGDNKPNISQEVLDRNKKILEKHMSH